MSCIKTRGKKTRRVPYVIRKDKKSFSLLLASDRSKFNPSIYFISYHSHFILYHLNQCAILACGVYFGATPLKGCFVLVLTSSNFFRFIIYCMRTVNEVFFLKSAAAFSVVTESRQYAVLVGTIL
jgi:hypothetical protein